MMLRGILLSLSDRVPEQVEGNGHIACIDRHTSYPNALARGSARWCYRSNCEESNTICDSDADSRRPS
jgi:hypothetical protein